jgi:hypothetical protein
VELVQELHGDYLKPPPPGPKPVFPKKIYQALSDSAPERLVPRVQPQDKSVIPIDTSKPKPNAIAYAFYETKGSDAKRFKTFIRLADDTDERFSMETSDGEMWEGSLAEISRDYLLTDREYVQNGYSRTLSQNASGRKEFDLP